MPVPGATDMNPDTEMSHAWLSAQVARLERPMQLERSVKLSPGRACLERLLVGIDPTALPFSAIEPTLDAMGMTQDGRRALHDALAGANKLLFGIEQTSQRTVLKVYLEFWERLVRELRSGRNRGEPTLLYQGFKWDRASPSRLVTDRYVCHPLLPIRNILKRIHALYPFDAQPPLDQLIREASRPLIRDSFVYLEVSGNVSARRSFDLNIYKAGMTLGRAADRLRAIAGHYGVGPALEPILNTHGHQLIGHISGGMGREGEDFTSFYYEVDEP